jgi:hypothetical protein
MKNIVGQAVRKSDFWIRKYEIEDIWDAIENGCSVLQAAPRRVGKTSIMFYMLDNPRDGYIPIYIDTESADSESEFWAKIFHALMEEEFINSLPTQAVHLWQKIKSLKINKISTKGVEFGDGKTLDYKLALQHLIKNLECDKKLVIMIDEFAQTIENIIQYENKKNAISLLKAHRELRLDKKFSDKVSFIYAGSIGLESVVARIDSIKHINDLNNITIGPLSIPEATEFANSLFSSVDINPSVSDIEYMLRKIEWLIPFYIQLIIQEIKKLYRRKPVIEQKVIDQAIAKALDNRNYFESWLSKLKPAFEKSEYLFAKDLLNKISEQHIFDSLSLNDLATQHKLTADQTKDCIKSLIYDGYINNNDDVKKYRFNSPILRMWWKKHVAN